MTNSQRKEFKKDIKDLEQNLIEKANLEQLSFSERKQYEELMQRKRNTMVMLNQIIIATLIILGITATILFIKYGKPELLNQPVSGQRITYYKVKGLSDRTSEDLLQRVRVHIEKNDEANTYYNNAIKQYNKEKQIDQEYIGNLNRLKEFNDTTSLKDLDILFEEIINQKIQVLDYLHSGNQSLSYINNKMIEIEDLKNTYIQSLAYILKEKNIKYECTPDGITIY